MAHGPRYKVPRRRRLEGKTDYHRRYKMVRSNKARLVIRKTNKYIIAQIVFASPIGDFTVTAAHSRELVKYFGWQGGTKNTPAAYLTGYLVGLRALRIGIKEAVADIGLHRPVKGAKVFAVVKGALDAGLEAPINKEVIPSEDRIRGETIAKYAEQLASTDPEKFHRQFSDILRRGLDPRELPKHFEEVKKRIDEVYSRIPPLAPKEVAGVLG
ncbi:MAG: 50S ribosomal protein L18 [Thermoprotei archaeon]|nr:MAG: 50S ribosomal protein L18 [Thermoprotei archaeon]